VAGASAVLAAGTIGATSAKAQLTNMLQSGIQRPTAGINIGTTTMEKGTIQYTNSAGNNDAFSVGTSTAINASASASSTSDYQVTSTASFDMGNNAAAGIGGGLSVINQQIGRSGAQTASMSLTTDESLAISTSAETTATEETNKLFKTDTDTSSSSSGGTRYWRWRNNRWNQFTGTETEAKTAYESAKTAEYNKQYDSAFSSSLSKKAAEESGEGTISGSFVKNAGASTTSNFESAQYRNVATGEIVNSSDYTRVEISDANASGNLLKGSYSTTELAEGGYEFQSSDDSFFKATQEVLQVSDFKQTQDSKNDVTVKGINSENNIVADDAAEFTSTISKIDTTTTGTASGTASGSAGGTVSTTASASASSSSFINSFVQAY
jgi:hypothetical protein